MLMAHNRIWLLVVVTHTFFVLIVHGLRAPDGGQSYLATLITRQNCTKLLFYTLPGAIDI